MKPDKGRKRKKTVIMTPERAKNGRNRRRVLLSKADSGKKWRYGQSIERID